MQKENSGQVNLKEILADVYKKRAVLAQELDIMAQDPRQRKTRRYNKLIDSYDKLTKRVVDILILESREAEGDEDRDRDIVALIHWSHTRDEKQPLITIKDGPPVEKISLMVHKDGSDISKDDVDELIDRAMSSIYGESFREFQYKRKIVDHST